MRADILHVDLDAFYVSVERRGKPELRGRPVVVGGDGNRGVVLSCSYETRARGVRNGMPSPRARRLCPDAVFVRPDFERYGEASRSFRAVLSSFTPRVEPISLDEAFCDVSGAHRLYGSSVEIAERIRALVRAQLGLVCSVGGGETKLVAKVASRACKPDGVLIVTDPEAFLHPRPVSDLWGVGDVIAAGLHGLGISTIGDLAAMPEALLREAVGEATAAHLHRLACGEDPSPVEPPSGAKTIGAEETFEHDVSDPEELAAELLRLSDRVASRLVGARLRARTITVKIRLATFETHTRSTTLRTPAQDIWTIFRTARGSYEGFRRGGAGGRGAVRLLGVAAAGLTRDPVAEQLSFEARPRYEDAEQAVALVRRRFGSKAVSLARLLGHRRQGR